MEVVGRDWSLPCGEPACGRCLYLPEALISSRCSLGSVWPGTAAPSGCPSLSVSGTDKSETGSSRGAVSKVRGDWKSVNLRPASELGKAGPQGCRHRERGWWPCPPQPLHLSLLPSLFPCFPCWGLAVGGWTDGWMNGWVGFPHALGCKASPATRGMGSKSSLHSHHRGLRTGEGWVRGQPEPWRARYLAFSGCL